MRFRRLLSGLGCALALTAALTVAGCGDKGGLDAAKVDTALSSDTAQNAFAISCGIFNVLSSGYDTYMAAHPEKISQKAQNAIALAKAALVSSDGQSNICTPPYPTDVTTAASKVANALLSVYSAYSALGVKVPAVTITASGAVEAAVDPAPQPVQTDPAPATVPVATQ